MHRTNYVTWAMGTWLLVASCGGSTEPAPADDGSKGGAASTLGCPTGITLCGNMCTDTSLDSTNCGTCGVVCAIDRGATCQKGACVITTSPASTGGATATQSCPAGTTHCGDVCTSTMVDPSNCGACGTTCSGTASLCSQGSCISPCASAQTKCGNACVDTRTDLANCGGCGMLCRADASCVNGTCVNPL